MDTQQAYEAIRAHFSTYGAHLARIGESGLCKYRTDDGQKCAVGCLIPDERYSEAMENSVISPAWLGRNPFLDGLFHGVDKKFLRSAQLLHDAVAKDAESFVKGLDVLALAFGLALTGASVVSGDAYLDSEG